MAKEETIGGEACDGSYRTAEFVAQWTNHRTVRKPGTNELARDREDQAGLDECTQGAGEKIRKRQPFVRDGCDRGLDSIAGEIDPFQEVGNFVSANAEDDLEHLHARRLLAHRRVEAGAALFYVSEVEGCCVGDHLDVGGRAIQIRIGNGDSGAVCDGNGLWKRGAKVRVGFAAIADEPAGVNVEALEAGEAADVVRSGCPAALKGSELVEVDRAFPFGLQVSVEERGMADFVKSVAGDLLWAVGIEVREGSLIAVQLWVRGDFNG